MPITRNAAFFRIVSALANVPPWSSLIWRTGGPIPLTRAARHVWSTAVVAIRQGLPPIAPGSADLLHHLADLAKATVEVRGGLFAELSSVGRRGCAIDERVAPRPAEYMIFKEHASAFVGTPLIGHLVARHVDTLLISGCSTSPCVRATATDAKSLGLRPMIVREAGRIVPRSLMNGRCLTFRPVSPMSSALKKR